MVNFIIDGRELSVPKGTTILEAAEKAGIPIPHLCFLKEINEIIFAVCTLCRDHEKAGFIEGVKVGMHLSHESSFANEQ